MIVTLSQSCLEVGVSVSTEEDDEEDADGDALDAQPDRDVTALTARHAQHSEHGHDDPEHEAAEEEEEHGAVDHGEGVLLQRKLLIVN